MKIKTQNLWIKSIFCLSFILMGMVFLITLFQITIQGISALFTTVYTNDFWISLLNSAVNTALLILFTLGISLPISVLSAMYLWFYKYHFSSVIRIVRSLIDALGAVPSIVYGMFGLIVFVDYLNFGFSLLSGVFTMSVIVLPILIRSCEQALDDIPEEMYFAGISLGLSKFFVMSKVLLPHAKTGILTGVFLSIGRIIGESAALIFTFGTASGTARSFLSSGSTLAVRLYALTSEGLYMQHAFVCAFILLIFAALFNTLPHYWLWRKKS